MRKEFYNKNGLKIVGDYYPILINMEFGINYRYYFEKNGKHIAEFNLPKSYKNDFNLEDFSRYITDSLLSPENAVNDFFNKLSKGNTLKYDSDAKNVFEDFINKFDVIKKIMEN